MSNLRFHAVPRIVYLVGGIASGKSSVARKLEHMGAVRIDLDQLSREVLAPGSALLSRIAEKFGADLIAADGSLRRADLAERVFISQERTAALESLELPAIKARLKDHLESLKAADRAPVCVVVEVPLPNKMGTLAELADEVLGVMCPLEIRRQRALGRGMSEQDFNLRAAQQLSDEELEALCDSTLDNSGDEQSLTEQIQRWWAARFSQE